MLSIIGIVIAAYVAQSFLRQTPIVCVNSGCELIRKSPQSYLFGIPVPAFGFVGYTLIATLSFMHTLFPGKQLRRAIVAIAAFGFLFVTWFTLTEIFIIKAVCMWCAVSALIMISIFLLSLILYYKERRVYVQK